jgi:hypothetical protein
MPDATQISVKLFGTFSSNPGHLRSMAARQGGSHRPPLCVGLPDLVE